MEPRSFVRPPVEPPAQAPTCAPAPLDPHQESRARAERLLVWVDRELGLSASVPEALTSPSTHGLRA